MSLQTNINLSLHTDINELRLYYYVPYDIRLIFVYCKPLSTMVIGTKVTDIQFNWIPCILSTRVGSATRVPMVQFLKA